VAQPALDLLVQDLWTRPAVDSAAAFYPEKFEES